jgi:hypothetical protein
MKTKIKTIACDQCHTIVNLTGHVGRTPRFCSAECRRVGNTIDERRRRAERRKELDRLRTIVQKCEAALAA